MKKNLFYPAANIVDVMKKLDCDVSNLDEYDYPLSLRTLETQVGGHYVDQVLSGAVDSIVHRRDFGLGLVRFEWDATGKYAPGIRFAVMSTDTLTLDGNGFLTSPILYDHANLVLPLLNFDFRGNTADALVTWGCYARTDFSGNKLEDENDPGLTDNQRAFWRTGGGQIEIVHNFCLASTKEAAHVLIVVPWGGAHSETRGQSEKILSMTNSFERGLEFFQSCSSDRGAKGYDFYIIDIAKAVEAKALEDFRRMLSRNYDNALLKWRYRDAPTFHRKYTTFQKIDAEHDEFRKRLFQIKERFKTRYTEEVKGSELAKRSCVVLPEKIDFVNKVDEYLKIPVRPADCLCEMEELKKAQIPSEAWDQLGAIETTANAKIDAWLDFAPLYADLADVVIQKCHGEAKVYLDCLKMTMPNTYLLETNVPGTGAYNTRKYDFSETHLGACAEYVQEFLDNSRAKREESLSAIGKLTGKNSDSEAPAEDLVVEDQKAPGETAE